MVWRNAFRYFSDICTRRLPRLKSRRLCCSAGLTHKDWLEFCQSMKNDASIWVNDLPDVEKARIENYIRSKLKTEGYSQQEIDVAVGNALDSKISDILHVLVD